MSLSTPLARSVSSKSLKRFGGEYRNRTGVHGFAIRCVTTPPTRLCGVKSSDKPDSGAKRIVELSQELSGSCSGPVPFVGPYCGFLWACPARFHGLD